MTKKFDVLIDLIDRFSAPMARINRSIVSTHRSVSVLGGRFARLGQYSGLTGVAKAAGGAAKSFGALGASMGGVLGPVAALGAIGSAGGMVELSKSAAEFGKEIDKSAVKTGIAVDQLAKYHHIATAMNVDTDTLDNSFVRLNRTLATAAAGKNKDGAALFQKLGIGLRDGNKHVRTAADIFPLLADAFQKNGNAALRTRMAMTLFGKSGAEMIPFLQMGSKELARLSAEYERYYGKITPKMLASMREGDEAFDRADLAAKGLKLTLGSALLPTIVKMVKPLTEWVVANRQIIATKVSDWATRVGSALMKVRWAEIGRDIEKIAHAAAQVAKFLGPMGTVIAGTTLLLSPFIASTLSAGLALGKLGVRLAMLSFGTVISMIGNFVVAIRAGYTVMEAFNLVLAANPIGAIVIGIAALAGAAYLIYKNWTPIKKFFIDVWHSIVAAFEWAWKKIKPIVDPILQAARWIGRTVGNAFSAPAAAGSAAAVNRPLYGKGGAAGRAGAAGANGAVRVDVNLHNAPPGTKVRTAKAGNVTALNTGVRFAY